MGEVFQKFEVKIPGSTANLGPGFDSFGLALPLFLTIRVESANETSIHLIGEHLANLPADENNLIYQTIKHLFLIENKQVPSIRLEIESDIPLARGIGSSGAAIVGGLIAANRLLREPKSQYELLQIATAIEGHADNVGASLYGGFVVTAYDGKEAKIATVPFPEDLLVILAIPRYTLSTNIARQRIPEHIPLKDVAFNIGHASLFIAYLLSGQLDKIPTALKDKVHQPYRQEMVRGLQRLMIEAERKQRFSVALSGAGPTILLLVQKQDLMIAENVLKDIVVEENLDLEIKTMGHSQKGAQLFANNLPS